MKPLTFKSRFFLLFMGTGVAFGGLSSKSIAQERIHPLIRDLVDVHYSRGRILFNASAIGILDQKTVGSRAIHYGEIASKKVVVSTLRNSQGAELTQLYSDATNGDHFGQNLIFDRDGKIKEATRCFDAKRSEDPFHLRVQFTYDEHAGRQQFCVSVKAETCTSLSHRLQEKLLKLRECQDLYTDLGFGFLRDLDSSNERSLRLFNGLAQTENFQFEVPLNQSVVELDQKKKTVLNLLIEHDKILNILSATKSLCDDFHGQFETPQSSSPAGTGTSSDSSPLNSEHRSAY